MSGRAETTPVTLRIVGRTLPGKRCGEHRNVHVGIQRRREVETVTPGDAASVVFEAALDVLVTDTGELDFRGPFAQGPRGRRFVYLSWGDVDPDGTFTMFGRAKLNLFTVPDTVAAAMTAGRDVTATLDLIGPRGGPLCAAIKPAQLTWDVDG